MNYPTSFDLLIECRGCGLENLLTGFTATQPAVCNQCRERLLDLEMETTHQELVCEDCRMILLLSKDAPILAGESVCRCGSTRFLRQKAPTLPQWVQKAQAAEPEGPAEEDFDWCRPSGSEDNLNDYNDLFDKDPAH